jgi:LysM repeat protein
MHEQRIRNRARLLAPVALALVTVVILIIVIGSGGGGGDKSSGSGPGASQGKGGSRRSSTPTGPKRRTYTVKTGDTLGAIASKTGVPVDKLLELNPQLDPQALVSGQKIKLRE